jgi:hypothetical protein
VLKEEAPEGARAPVGGALQMKLGFFKSFFCLKERFCFDISFSKPMWH